MIDVNTKIHDRFSIEFKVGFSTREGIEENNFALNTWIFIPNSLDINPSTYDKKQFYIDLKSNVRLITPVFPLGSIVAGEGVPLRNIEQSFRALVAEPSETTLREYEYQIKMFSAIVKSALRQKVARMIKSGHDGTIEPQVEDFMRDTQLIIDSYRSLRKIVNVPGVPEEAANFFLFGDEFICNSTAQYMFRLVDFLKKSGMAQDSPLIASLVAHIKSETDYKRKMGYATVQTAPGAKNREFLYRNGVLKKYIESDLFLNANKKKDGALIEQIYLSIAAGVSMIFATVVAFSFQMKYGNFTMPLFVALVIGYMLKDRIKELMRYYFAHRLGQKYFDHKTTVSIKQQPVGWIRDGVDFISEAKVPREVMNIRSRSALLEAENRNKDEKILLYRKTVEIDRQAMERDSQYAVAGINDITRLYINELVSKTDNPETRLSIVNDDGTTSTIMGQKIYYLNIIMQLKFEEQLEYKRFRVIFNRQGIEELEELNPITV